MKYYNKLYIFVILLTVVVFLKSTGFAQAITFTQSQQRFPDVMTYQVALGDLDKDGDSDAVWSNMGPNNSTIWWNDGHGQFNNSGQTLTQSAHGIALGDLDNDGDLDVFIVCVAEGVSRTTWIYFNDGTGHMTNSSQNLNNHTLNANGVDLIDIDSDGDLDAQILYYDGINLYYKFFINDGNGFFAESNLTFPPNNDLTWGDLDSDGDFDIFIKAHLQRYEVLLNEGNLNFSTFWELTDTCASRSPNQTILEDFDGDGDRDAFVINRLNGKNLPGKVFFNDGTGQFFDSGQRLGSYDLWYCLKSGDLDNDGDKDVFISAHQQPNHVWRNDGSGYFTDPGLRFGGNANHIGVDLGDLDGDNDIDAFVATFGSGSNEVWFNKTPPLLPPPRDSITISIRSGWNMLSLPVDSICLKKDIIPCPTSEVFYYEPDSSGYISEDTLRTGKGYWFKFSLAGAIKLYGDSLFADTFIVKAGWNMIGSISTPVMASSIVSDPPGMITSNFFRYNTGYVVSDTILPGSGYWIKVDQTGRLIITTSEIVCSSRCIRIVYGSENPPSPPEEGMSTKDEVVPSGFVLYQNYPNPFNPSTNIGFDIPARSHTRLDVFNVLGSLVRTLVDEEKDEGSYSITWDGKDNTGHEASTGLYYYRLRSGNFYQAQKGLLIK